MAPGVIRPPTNDGEARGLVLGRRFRLILGPAAHNGRSCSEIQATRLRRLTAEFRRARLDLLGDEPPTRSSRALLNSAVSLRKRVACISAMSEFFRSFVAPATAGLAYEEADPFHSACFMWWHILALSPTHSETPEPDLQDACLTAMSEILALPSDVCRMSALHGLNHWQEHYGERVESTIDAFLAGRPEIAAPIREYAMIARSGQCL